MCSRITIVLIAMLGTLASASHAQMMGPIFRINAGNGLEGGGIGRVVRLDVGQNAIDSSLLADIIDLGDSFDNPGLLALLNGVSTDATIVLDGAAGPDQGGRIDLLRGDATTSSASIYPTQDQGGELDLYNNSGFVTAGLTGGGSGRGAYLIMQNGVPRMSAVTVILNADPFGALSLNDAEGFPRFLATADTGGSSAVSLVHGNIDTVRLDAKGPFGGGALKLKHGLDDQTLANLFTTDVGGQLDLNKTDGSVGVQIQAAGAGAGGRMALSNGDLANNRETIVLDGNSTENSGRIALQTPDATTVLIKASEGDGGAQFELSAGAGIGNTFVLDARSNADGGAMTIRNGFGTDAINLFGDFGDGTGARIKVSGQVIADEFICAATGDDLCPGDLAEIFELSDHDAIKPGMVLVIDPDQAGNLTTSAQAYDKRVAGIVSGAGDLRPGMKLGGRADGTTDLPIALSGRVYCYVDASERAVEVGDLLTTSKTPGYAMKAADHQRAFGAVLGKAMQPLAKGEKGLVLVLVALQ